MALKRYSAKRDGDPRCRTFGPVTKHDVNPNLDFITKYIEIGDAGSLSVKDVDGNVVSLGAFPAGHRFDIEATQVMATNTSATIIVAYYG